MRLAKYLGMAAAVSLAAAPVVASAANPAAKLSVSQSKSARATTALSSANRASSTGYVVGAIALALGVITIILVADGDDEPNSP